MVLVGAEGVLAGREMRAGGEVEDFVEVLALDPELVLAGDVSGVVADLEGGDDDGADGPGLGCLGGAGGCEQKRGKEGEDRDTKGVGAHAGLLVKIVGW